MTSQTFWAKVREPFNIGCAGLSKMDLPDFKKALDPVVPRRWMIEPSKRLGKIFEAIPATLAIRKHFGMGNCSAIIYFGNTAFASV
jgi:hypothetical protein